MNSSALDSLTSKPSPNDVQYAVHVKLTPEVLQALLHAQKIGEHVSLRFAEENKTDVWTIGNQQFSCKGSREDKSDLVEVVKCSGDPAQGVPCSPQACVFKKLLFPKTSQEAHFGWKQAQASKKQQEKRVAKLLDASFNDKGGKGVKHTVRHTAPVANRAAAPPRSVATKPLLAQSRPSQRHPTPPPPSASKDPVEVVQRPLVKTLNPPKPRSLKPGLQKKDAAKSTGAAGGKPAASGQTRGAARQGAKGSSPSPPQRSSAAPDHATRHPTQTGSPDITSSGSPDEGQHHIAHEPEDLQRPSPQVSGQYKGHDTHIHNTKKVNAHAAPRNSHTHTGGDSRVSPAQADNTKQDNSPTSFKSRQIGHGETLSPASQQDTHDSKRSKSSPPAVLFPKQPSPTPYSFANAGAAKRPSPPLSASDHGDHTRPRNPYTAGRFTSQLKRSPALAAHGQEPAKPPHTSPASGYHESAAGSQKIASGEHSSHHSDGFRSQNGNGYDRPSSQDSWQGRTPSLNPYTASHKRSAPDDNLPVKKPKRTPSLPHLHRLNEHNAQEESAQLSPPVSWSEGARRPARPISAMNGFSSQPVPSRTPASDYTAATAGAKRTRSQNSEEGEQARQTPSDIAANMTLPPTSQTSKPAASSSPAKRPREDSSPPSSTHTANPPRKKLVLKIKRPSETSTPSTGGSSGGLSVAAQNAATPEVSMQDTAPKLNHLVDDLKESSLDQHVDRPSTRCTPARDQSGIDLGQAGSISLADTRPSSSGSPGKAAMAYTPDQDEDEREYSEFLSRKPHPVVPISSYDEYLEAKNRYQQLYGLYAKLRHRSESFMSELNALYSAVQSHGSSGQAAQFREKALALVGRKSGVFERWQKALGNLKLEIYALKDAAGTWRRTGTI